MYACVRVCVCVFSDRYLVLVVRLASYLLCSCSTGRCLCVDGPRLKRWLEENDPGIGDQGWHHGGHGQQDHLLSPSSMCSVEAETEVGHLEWSTTLDDSGYLPGLTAGGALSPPRGDLSLLDA